MFSKFFNPQLLHEALLSAAPDTKKALAILASKNFGTTDLAQLLLSFNDPEVRQAVIEAAAEQRKKLWQQQLFLMPPLYISAGDPKSHGCLDHCTYCFWRNGNVPEEQLARLSPEEVQVEARHLVSMGYGDIELVAATDGNLLDPQRAAEMVAAARQGGAQNIGINFFPMRTVDDYRVLVDAGCTYAIVWQETYLAKKYDEVHPRGPKSQMNYRLDAHDRALQGGVPTAGVAFLGGLADWRFEALATMVHARYLEQTYNANIIFGMPRRKDAGGNSVNLGTEYYDDAAYEFVGALFSLAIPAALPWFSTREDFDLSAQCVRGGGCLFTLDCSTEVGGYTKQGGFGQFPVHSRSISDGINWLKALGFSPKTNLPW